MARFLQFDSIITRWGQTVLRFLGPVSDHWGQHSHYKELIIKQQMHFWNSWCFTACQKQIYHKAENPVEEHLFPIPTSTRKRLQTGVLKLPFQTQTPNWWVCHNPAGTELLCIPVLFLLILYPLFEAFTFLIQNFQTRMPEARHLNPYLWILSYAAGYPQTQTNLIKNHKHLQKKKIN